MLAMQWWSWDLEVLWEIWWPFHLCLEGLYVFSYVRMGPIKSCCLKSCYDWNRCILQSKHFSWRILSPTFSRAKGFRHVMMASCFFSPPLHPATKPWKGLWQLFSVVHIPRYLFPMYVVKAKWAWWAHCAIFFFKNGRYAQQITAIRALIISIGVFVGDPRGPRDPHVFEPHIQPWHRQQGLGLPADGRCTGTASCAAREGVASGMAARRSGNAGTCWNPGEILMNLEEPGDGVGSGIANLRGISCISRGGSGILTDYGMFSCSCVLELRWPVCFLKCQGLSLWPSAGMFVIFVSHQWLGVAWHGKNSAARTDGLFVSFCHHSHIFKGYQYLRFLELTTWINKCMCMCMCTHTHIYT